MKCTCWMDAVVVATIVFALSCFLEVERHLLQLAEMTARLHVQVQQIQTDVTFIRK
jgi:hypothetical protein